MKKALLIALTVLAASFAASAPAAETKLNVLLTGGPGSEVIRVSLSADGTSYVITSAAPLEAPTGICAKSDESGMVLSCEAPKIASFEVNAGAGHDYIVFSPKVPVPVTVRGGPGIDHLYGGAGDDKLVGGAESDSLNGRGGNDWLYGGSGGDTLFGGPGDDRLLGGPGFNEVFGGSGNNTTG